MELSAKLSQYVLSTYGRFPITPVKGKGVELWDAEGKRYLDFCTGIAVCSLGHCHPKMVEAITKQANELIHCSNLYQIPAQAELAKVIIDECVRIEGKIFFSNSGAEANDGLIKLARRFGHARPNEKGESRYEIITFNKSFHGRTIGAMAATAQEKIQERFHPLLPGFAYCPFNDIGALEHAIGDRTAAILLEPIQGEGGINPAKKEFLSAIQKLCKKHDLLLMLDEVQCGFGRAGHLMGWRAVNEDIVPDAISWAKGMGGGFPIGCFWVSDRMIEEDTKLSSLLGPGSHGSTYGGNPLASATALAVLREIIDENLRDNVVERSQQIQKEIASWSHPAVVEVRGAGLLLGIGLNSQNIATPEGTTPAVHMCNVLAEKGMLVPPAGADTIRLLPPLNVTPEEIKEALSILKSALDEVV